MADKKTLRAFAERERLHVRLYDGNERTIPGRDGLIYEYGGGKLCVLVMPGDRRKIWGHRRRLGLNAGMEVHQDGDYEGSLLFDPENAEHSELAIKFAHIRRKKTLQPEDRERLSNYMRGWNRGRQAGPIKSVGSDEGGGVGVDRGNGVLDETEA
jgi:hypothetical protein